MATMALHTALSRVAVNRDVIERYVDSRFRDTFGVRAGLATASPADVVAADFETHASNMGDYWKVYVFTNAPAVTTAMTRAAEAVKDELEREGVVAYLDVQARPGMVLVPKTN